MADPPAGGLLSNMFYTYVIQSLTTGKIYIGQTYNLTARIDRHNGLLNTKKKNYTTKNVGPWHLIYHEVFQSRDEAIFREKQLKSCQGRKWLKDTFVGP